jgi:hypothetical protein
MSVAWGGKGQDMADKAGGGFMAHNIESGNAERAERAFRALTRHLDYEDDKATAVRDLLSDLRHFCDEQAIDYAEQDRIAYDNYRAEANDPECNGSGVTP